MSNKVSVSLFKYFSFWREGLRGDLYKDVTSNLTNKYYYLISEELIYGTNNGLTEQILKLYYSNHK